jgi:hypothetical protein
MQLTATAIDIHSAVAYPIAHSIPWSASNLKKKKKKNKKKKTHKL